MERGLINKLNLKCIVKTPSVLKNVFDKVMQMCVESGVRQVEFTFVMGNLSADVIRKIVNIVAQNKYLEDSGNDSIITFALTVSATPKLRKIIAPIKNNLVRVEIVYDENKAIDVYNTCQKLINDKLPCALKIQDAEYSQVCSIYRKASKIGIPVVVAESSITYKTMTISDFEKWAYDTNGCRLNLFSNFATHIILGYWGTCCKYKSCLTKYLTIDCDKGTIYSCMDERTPIGNIFELNSIDSIFSNKSFISMLENAINKRNSCKKECEFFDICQGGCPLETYDVSRSCSEKEFFLLYKEIETKLRQIITNEDYRNLNPALAEIILSGASSNKLFEGGFV